MQRKRGIYTKIISISVLLLILYSAHPFLLRSYANFFTVNNYEKGADAILILGGSADTRAKKATNLLRSGYAPIILITQPAAPIREYKDIIVDDYKNLITILNFEKVPFKEIINKDGGAKSTFDEARDLINYLKDNQLNKIIIVTDNFHTRRAIYAFRKIFKESNIGVTLEIAGAENNIYDSSNWWKTERGLNAYVSELFKFSLYLISDQNLKGISTE